MVAQSPSPYLFQAMLRTIQTCDARARLLIIPVRPRQRRIAVHVLGDWDCPRCRILDALTALFCEEASRHD